MIQSIRSLLNQPFPLGLPGRAANWLRISIALLVYFILAAFKPFGLSVKDTDYLIIGYGLITYVTLTFFETVIQRMFPTIFNEETWTVGKAMLWLWVIIFFIGILNGVYCVITDTHGAGFIAGGLIFIYTWIVGIFPFALGILGRFALLYRKYKHQAEELSMFKPETSATAATIATNNTSRDYSVVLFQDNRKSKVLLQANEILAIESAENYITIYSRVDQALKKIMLRSTLQSAEESTRNIPFLVRCHRSFIVNLAHVTNLTGNAQGYKLEVLFLDKALPVSRKYEKEVVENLRRVKNESFSDHFEANRSSLSDIQLAPGK